MMITFYYPDVHDLEATTTSEVDDWCFWNTTWMARRRAWSLRTALSLQRAGYDVAISDRLPASGIVVVGPELSIRRSFLQQPWCQRRHLITVAIRADLPRCFFADFEIVQNGYYADEQRVFHVPHWPQYGIIPRDPGRQATIQTVSFKGHSVNLHPSFAGPAWQRFLDKNDLRMPLNFEGERTNLMEDWHDYRNVDLVLAVRQDLGSPYYDKPASKLINAWIAGVPALLGPEHAYRELRRSPLDYLEVRSTADAMSAIRQLRADPSLYAAMIANGHRRAQAFSDDHYVSRWAEVLFVQVPHLARAKRARLVRSLPTPAKRIALCAQAPPASEERRWLARYHYENITRWVKADVRPWLGVQRRRLQTTLDLSA